MGRIEDLEAQVAELQGRIDAALVEAQTIFDRACDVETRLPADHEAHAQSQVMTIAATALMRTLQKGN